MRGAVAVSANLNDITVTQGEEALTLYQFNTHEAKHYFCSKCGIYTFHQRRSVPTQYGVNVACIEGMSHLTSQRYRSVKGGIILKTAQVAG